MKKIIFLTTIFASSLAFCQNRFETTGNAGIGTSTPIKLLDVQNSNGGTGESYVWIKKGFDATNVNREAGIILGTNAGDYGNTFKIVAMSSTSYFDYPKLNFKYTNPGGTKIIDLLTIDSFGNLGIGTTTPTQKLDVNGNINMAGVAGRRLFMGGAVGSTFGIAYDSTYPNYGIFYTEGEPDYVSISPNGNATAGVVNVFGNGYVGIGTTNPTSKLTFAGNINAREVKVTVDAGADFVFDKDYDLLSLTSVDNYIKQNKHLPEIASAKEMQANGINLSEMNIKLLQKMEEMTLYMIEQNKISQELVKKVEKLESALKTK